MTPKLEEHPTVRRHCGSQIAFFAGGPSHAILFRTIVMVRRVISTRQLQKKRVDRKFLRHFKLKSQVNRNAIGVLEYLIFRPKSFWGLESELFFELL